MLLYLCHAQEQLHHYKTCGFSTNIDSSVENFRNIANLNGFYKTKLSTGFKNESYADYCVIIKHNDEFFLAKIVSFEIVCSEDFTYEINLTYWNIRDPFSTRGKIVTEGFHLMDRIIQRFARYASCIIDI